MCLTFRSSEIGQSIADNYADKQSQPTLIVIDFSQVACFACFPFFLDFCVFLFSYDGSLWLTMSIDLSQWAWPWSGIGAAVTRCAAKHTSRFHTVHSSQFHTYFTHCRAGLMCAGHFHKMDGRVSDECLC